MNIPSHHSERRGFTLVEIMIVVAIIALLASMAVPNFLRARKRSQATRDLEDLRIIDNAQDEYAIENNKTAGAPAAWADLRAYVKTGTVLYNTGADIFGNTYGPFTVDTPGRVPIPSFSVFSDVAPAAFWSPWATP